MTAALRFFVAALLLHHAAAAAAISTGIVGNSGKQGANCADCHNGGTAPIVRLEGPRAVYAGALATFRFVVQSQSSRQQVAGFNVAASDGALESVRGQGARGEFGELTHDFPKAAEADESSWLFTWRAPPAAGAETLFAAGLSANGNATRSGDEMGLLQLVVIVSDEPRPGDANCDGWLSAADLTEIAHLTAVGKTEECALADANCDGAVDAADIAVVIASLFDSPAATECEEAGGAQ